MLSFSFSSANNSPCIYCLPTLSLLLFPWRLINQSYSHCAILYRYRLWCISCKMLGALGAGVYSSWQFIKVRDKMFCTPVCYILQHWHCYLNVCVVLEIIVSNGMVKMSFIRCDDLLETCRLLEKKIIRKLVDLCFCFRLFSYGFYV